MALVAAALDMAQLAIDEEPSLPRLADSLCDAFKAALRRARQLQLQHLARVHGVGAKLCGRGE